MSGVRGMGRPGLTGLRGISWRRQNPADGAKRVEDSIVALWRDEDRGGKPQAKAFSILQYGLRVALELACDHRSRAVGEPFIEGPRLNAALTQFLPHYCEYWGLDLATTRKEVLLAGRATIPGADPSLYLPPRKILRQRTISAELWAEIQSLYEEGAHLSVIQSHVGVDESGKDLIESSRLYHAAKSEGWVRPFTSLDVDPERINSALELLATTGWPMHKVAEEVGIHRDTLRKWLYLLERAQ